jgi:hypothetical protein
MDAELARLYRRWTFFAHAEHRRSYLVPIPRLRHRQRASLAVDGECAQRRPAPYKTCRAYTEAAVSFPGMYGFGVFARYVAGWDSYNVGFRDSVKNPRHGNPIFGVILQHALPTSFNAHWPPRGAIAIKAQ